jgi:uncharacterized UPF0146 family protein
MVKPIRVVSLVDWDNLFLRARELGKEVTPAWLAQTIKELRQRCNMRAVTDPFVFVTIKSVGSNFPALVLMDALARKNFTVVVTEVEPNAADRRLRKIAELTWDDTDSIIVMSADTGFSGISKMYQARDAEVVIAAFGEVSPPLKKVASRVFDLQYGLDFNLRAVIRDCLHYAGEGKVPDDGSLVLGAHRVLIGHVTRTAEKVAAHGVAISAVVEASSGDLRGLPFCKDDIKVICEELRQANVLVPSHHRQRIAFHATPVSEFILKKF